MPSQAFLERCKKLRQLITDDPTITNAHILNRLNITAAQRDSALFALERAGTLPQRKVLAQKSKASVPSLGASLIKWGFEERLVDLIFDGPHSDRLGPMLREAVELARGGSLISDIERELGIAARSGKEILRVAALHLQEIDEGHDGAAQ